MEIVNPQMIPVSSRPRSVERPESVKYCRMGELDATTRGFEDAYKRQENNRNHVFELLGQCDGEVALSWDDESNNERTYESFSDGIAKRGSRQTEDRVDADDIGKECGSEHQKDNERHEALRWPIVDGTSLDGDP